MEPKNAGLEDDFPFQLGDFLRFLANFRGCSVRNQQLIFQNF